MRSRNCLLLVLALVCAAAAWLLFHHFSPQPGITLRNLQRIESGMSREEAEAIIGSSPSVQDPDPFLDEGLAPPGCHRVLFWSGKELDIFVFLDRNERVIVAQELKWPQRGSR